MFKQFRILSSMSCLLSAALFSNEMNTALCASDAQFIMRAYKVISNDILRFVTFCKHLLAFALQEIEQNNVVLVSLEHGGKREMKFQTKGENHQIGERTINKTRNIRPDVLSSLKC